jgi:hypothetical protein
MDKNLNSPFMENSPFNVDRVKPLPFERKTINNDEMPINLKLLIEEMDEKFPGRKHNNNRREYLNT